MNRLRLFCCVLAFGTIVVGIAHVRATELVQLTAENWDDFAPQGKEVDCIYGDFVLRNDKIVVVVAQPLATRNANMTVHGVGGSIIDLTFRDRPNDQLSAFYPGGGRYQFTSMDKVEFEAGDKSIKTNPEKVVGSPRVSLVIGATNNQSGVDATVKYTLIDGDSFVLVETILKNTTDKPVQVEVSDAIRADRTFEFGTDEALGLFWANDDWFGQAYGVRADGSVIQRAGRGGTLLKYARDGKTETTIEPGETYTLGRQVFPGNSLLAVRGMASELAGKETKHVTIRVEDSAGRVAHAEVQLARGDEAFASGRTDAKGQLQFALPDGKYKAHVAALGRPETDLEIETGKPANFVVLLQQPGYVAAEITDGEGRPIPCKVAFHGVDGTPDPNFGPDSAAVGCGNLHYSHSGKFRQEIAPGKYRVIVSHGPEYDAVFTDIEVERGKATPLSASLLRTVDSAGWISSDFHSHSTPSGDNTTDQLGRVLNLLCEHIEFAPCTEHNRVDSYVPHLKHLGVEKLMATCSGMELTGSPLPVNHQNSFPLVMKPRTQDGGAPLTDVDPIVQIERLAMWDNGSDKLVQGNHPNIVQEIGDRDTDGKADGGFAKMFGFMDVIEVHPPQGIFTPPADDDAQRQGRNAIFHWMQLLNLGYRIPGVVNTDAHYTFHGSGWLRNYIKSPTDDPAKIETMDMVHAAEAGHIVMTNGPFMEVSLRATKPANGASIEVMPGDDVRAPGGEAEIKVRVQCPNWFDINRVQVFVNGRPDEKLNFTRRTTPDRFGDGVVKFEAAIPLALSSDAHIIVACAGEGLQLGPVMGSGPGKAMPVAVSNPIFVDIDGDGFQANGDLLDRSLPLEQTKTPVAPRK